MKTFIAAAFAAFAATAAAHADDAVLPMSMEDGALAGAGAEAILARLPDAQFILVGEDHGFADSPEITMALARAARPYGLKHHVVEAGPLSADWVTGVLKKGGPDDLGALLAGRPLALPFLNMLEDVVLADDVIDSGGTLWAVDQEFIGSPLILLESLAARAKTPDAKAETEALLTKEREAFKSFDQGSMLLISGDAAIFEKLRGLFAKDKPALAMIGALEESAGIYQSFGAGKGFTSNTDRVALIRRQFLGHYDGAREKTPRAIFKMGANHVGLGSTTLDTFDLGSLTEGVAAANGLKVLRVAFFPLDGKNTQIQPSPDGFFATADYHSKDIEDLLAAIGVAAEDIPAEGWGVIALDPMRKKLEHKGLKALPPEAKFILLGYDFLITTRGARPATPLAN
ncbi:MAG: hypothetical protein R3C58_02385 [Parvularculaceae bacterium]